MGDSIRELSVLVTGCSSAAGIGHATACELARAGHVVYATARDPASAPRFPDHLDGRIEVRRLDLLRPETGAAVVGEIVAAEGRLDVLVNNAGYGLIGGVEQVRLEQARANFETNLFGTMALVLEVLPGMRSRRSGHVVNVSTIFAAGLSIPAAGWYVASKAALESVCQALAVEAAPWGIRVTNFEPGPVATELSREWGDRLAPEGDPRPTLSDELYAWIADGGSPALESPADVAAALRAVVETELPPLAEQSAPSSRAYVAAALRDPTRLSELGPYLERFGTPPA